MKHNLKRLTALVLAVSMTLSLFSAAAWAADASEGADASVEVTADISEDTSVDIAEDTSAETSDEEDSSAEFVEEEAGNVDIEDSAAKETEPETASEEEAVATEGNDIASSSEEDTTGSSTYSFVTEAADLTYEATYNNAAQNYTYWASTINSYLVKTDDGLMRVEYDNSRIVVEYCDSNYNMITKKYVEAELSIFGAFYAGEDAYYLIFGQNNSDENDEAEVIRVVKYSTDWERLGQASLYGANTYIPFDAGSCRMTEYGGYLYIRTCHEMYASSDGLHHQANMMIVVQESTMEVTDSQYTVSNTGTGYVSHSFNQFIMVDDEGNLIALDHGDGYPRAAVLFRYTSKAGSDTFNTSNNRISVLSFEGSIGNNYTGASLGGLEYSGTSYLVAGSSVTQDDDWDSHTALNVFVTVTDRNNFTSDGTTVKWITDYDTDGDIYASTPQLVKLDTDSFLLLWSTTEYLDSDGNISEQSELHYVFLDGEGNTVSEIYTAAGHLSDCKPIVSGDSVIWYVTGNADNLKETEPVFYSISMDGTYSAQNTGSEVTSTDISNYSIELWPSDCSYDGLPWEPWVFVSDEDGYYLEEGWDYEVEYNNNVDPGTATVIVTGKNDYTGTLTAIFTISLDTPELSSVSNTTSGVKITWKAVFGAAKYRVFRKTGSGSWTKVADTTSTSYTDTSAVSGTTYKYTVRCINANGSSYTSSYDTAGLSITCLSTPTLSSVSNASSGITVKWAQVKGAQGYRIYRKAGSATSWTKVKTVTSGSAVSWTDTRVTNGIKYTYMVKAYEKSDGATYWSAKSSSKTTYRLTRPTISSLKNSASKKMTVKWEKNSKATGYQIQYSTSISFSSHKTVTVTSYKTVSKTISSLTKGKKYYVRVRTYKTVSGTKYYSAWSATKNVKISK